MVVKSAYFVQVGCLYSFKKLTETVKILPFFGPYCSFHRRKEKAFKRSHLKAKREYSRLIASGEINNNEQQFVLTNYLLRLLTFFFELCWYNRVILTLKD